jgi:hypothetical protein
MLSKENLLELYKNNYFEEYQIKYKNLLKQDIYKIAIELIKLENNAQLIQYYVRAFGFTQMSHTSISTAMINMLDVFMAHCSR